MKPLGAPASGGPALASLRTAVATRPPPSHQVYKQSLAPSRHHGEPHTPAIPAHDLALVAPELEDYPAEKRTSTPHQMQPRAAAVPDSPVEMPLVVYIAVVDCLEWQVRMARPGTVD